MSEGNLTYSGECNQIPCSMLTFLRFIIYSNPDRSNNGSAFTTVICDNNRTGKVISLVSDIFFLGIAICSRNTIDWLCQYRHTWYRGLWLVWSHSLQSVPQHGAISHMKDCKENGAVSHCICGMLQLMECRTYKALYLLETKQNNECNPRNQNKAM